MSKKRRTKMRRKFQKERVKCCPLSQAECVIVIDDALFEEIKECVERLDDEFIIFLEGTREERVAFIRSAYVPPQIVTRASVTSDEPFNPSRFVAVAHSHHHMGAFHSLTDEEGVDNAPISIVIARDGWCAKFAHRLPCGRWGVSRNVKVLRGSEYTPPPPPTLPTSEVSERSLGDCPERGEEVLTCGLRIKRNALLREIERKSKRPIDRYIERYTPNTLTWEPRRWPWT